MTRLGQATGDASNGRLEAHVEHAIHFVEDEDANHFELDEFAVEVVFEPAGSGDDDAGTAADGLQLWPFGHTADDEGDSVCGVGVEAAEGGLDLHGQLASGQQDQSRCRAGLSLGELFEDGNEKAEGLASAGLGGGEDVFAFERGRNGSGLDWRRGYKVESADALFERVGDLKIGKLIHLYPWSVAALLPCSALFSFGWQAAGPKSSFRHGFTHGRKRRKYALRKYRSGNESSG
uniref:Uncharacterized protein n=1 Tax=mine drainage metagenome TaxID=410659 RepID=E6QI67_9ZZZZ